MSETSESFSDSYCSLLVVVVLLSTPISSFDLDQNDKTKNGQEQKEEEEAKLRTNLDKRSVFLAHEISINLSKVYTFS